MHTSKKIAFIDIEANQLFKQHENKTEHFILEYSVFSAEKKGVLHTTECRCSHPLNSRLCQLLKKTRNHYQNIKKSEKEAYKELLKISKEYELICYGNYDQIILDSAAERNGLEKIKLFDFSEEINELFELPESSSVSLNRLKNLLKIKFNNEKEHNSFWDAKILKNIYLKIKSIKHIDKYKRYLYIERIRPKYYDTSRYKTNNFVEVSSNYRIFYFENKIIDIPGDELNEYGFPKIIRKDLSITIKIYDQKFNLTKEQKILIEDYKSEQGIIEFNKFKNDFLNKNKNFEKNLFIFDGKIWSKFFKINSNTYYSPYRVSLKLFESIKLSNQEKIAIIKKFYDKGKFDKDIDYEKIIKGCENFK